MANLIKRRRLGIRIKIGFESPTLQSPKSGLLAKATTDYVGARFHRNSASFKRQNPEEASRETKSNTAEIYLFGPTTPAPVFATALVSGKSFATVNQALTRGSAAIADATTAMQSQQKSGTRGLESLEELLAAFKPGQAVGKPLGRSQSELALAVGLNASQVVGRLELQSTIPNFGKPSVRASSLPAGVPSFMSQSVPQPSLSPALSRTLPLCPTQVNHHLPRSSLAAAGSRLQADRSPIKTDLYKVDLTRSAPAPFLLRSLQA